MSNKTLVQTLFNIMATTDYKNDIEAQKDFSIICNKLFSDAKSKRFDAKSDGSILGSLDRKKMDALNANKNFLADRLHNRNKAIASAHGREIVGKKAAF